MVDTLPAGRMELDRRVQVLRYRGTGYSAHGLESSPPDHRRTAAPERRVPVVLTELNGLEKQRLFVPAFLVVLEVLETIAVVELLRPLNEGNFSVFEIADHLVDERRAGHEIGIDDCDIVTL